MLQENIGIHSDNYALNVLYQNGKCKRIFIQRRIRKANKVGTVACASISIMFKIYQQIKTFGLKLLDELNWHGVACIEFNKDPSNESVKLIEINPKFWASTEMSLVAGVNFPYYLCEMAEGKELEYSEEYNRNFKFHFTLSRDLLQLMWNPKSIPNYILDVLNLKVKSNILLSDLKPNFIEFSTSLASLFLPKNVKSWLGKT